MPSDDTFGMIKRLASMALLAFPVSLVLGGGSASAAECGGLLSPCSQPSAATQPAPATQPAAQPAPQPAPQPVGTIAEEPGAAARILQLVNNERATAGLSALVGRSQIDSIAQGHSRDMAARKTIWHNDAYFTESVRRTLNASGLGENVAMNSSVEDAHRRLMASPGHRANILKGSFDAVGISVVHDERGMFYVTQNFVDSATATATPVKAPAAVPQAKRIAAPAAAAPAAAAPAVIAAQPVAAVQAAPAAPAELDHVLEAPVAPAPLSDGSPSVAGAVGAALAALVAALGALIRLA